MGLLLVAEYLYSYFKKKKLSKEILNAKDDISKKFDNIESIIELESKEIFKNKCYDWTGRLENLDKTKQQIRITRDDVIAIKLQPGIEGREKQRELLYALKDNISFLEAKLQSGETVTDYYRHSNNMVSEITNDVKLIDRSIRLNDPAVIKGNVASVLPGYLLDVYGKMESFVPDYTPKPGIMLNKPKKWKIKLSDNEVRGRYKRFFPKLELICSYRDVEPTVDELKKVNKSSNKYKVYCYVLPKVNSELRDFASRYQPANFGLFFYDLSSKELIKNNDNKMANFFEGYFKPSKKPARFTEMVIGEAEDGLLTHQQIAKFGKKVPYTLEKLNVVTKMSNDGYFVNECARG